MVKTKEKIPAQLRGMRFNRVRFGEKRAFESGWQKKPYSYDQIQNYFPKENYGVMCGKDVRVLDDDSKDKRLMELFVRNFGATFRVRDHLYFRFDNGHDKKIIFNDSSEGHLGELQGEGTYVVGAGSTHPDGSKYEQKNDLDMISISYDKFVEVFKEYIGNQNTEKRELKKINLDDDDFIKSIKGKWNEGDRQDLAMSVAGYLRKNKRLGLDSCLSIVESICNDCQDNEVSQRLAAVRATYAKDESEIKGVSGLEDLGVEVSSNLRNIILPKEGKLISTFAMEVAEIFKDKQTLFFRPASRDIVEVAFIEEKEDENRYLGFIPLKSDRFITLSEEFFNPVIEKFNKEKQFVGYRQKSMSGNVANITLCSPHLQNELPKINRIFHSPIPIIYNNELVIPKCGYDERFRSFTPHNAPKIKEVTIQKAKKIINNIFGEFCFQDKLDYTNAIAGLLTPFIRGLLPSFNTRTPMFVYTANRERAGKDYCAGITGLVHEGYALEEPPINTGERGGNNNDELRKKILSALLAGRKRLHFSNNKGHINNSVLEGFLTSEQHSDRALGRNDIVSLPNEIDVSLSGNVGIGFTPDLINRARFVRLFLAIEDANSRKFSTPNLHQWVKEHRSEILSALYSMVRNWFDKGCPHGKLPFSSFPDWARIVGGIMECSGFDNPCYTDPESLMIGGDTETADMKALFESAYEKYPNQWIKISQIKELISGNDNGLFSYLDFDKRADQTKFGLKISKFIGRYLSDILLKVKNKSVRGSRQEFMFLKEDGNHGKVGNLRPLHAKSKKKNVKRMTQSLPTLPTLPSSEIKFCSKCNAPISQNKCVAGCK